MTKKRLIYLVLFLIVLMIEILIALYVHDDFVRPYVGDVLVVVVIYFFVKIFLPDEHKWLPGVIFLFAALVELLQYFRLVEILGVENNTFLRTLIGSTFDVKDILCYGVGCIVLVMGEWIMRKHSILVISLALLLSLVGCKEEDSIIRGYTEEQLLETHEKVLEIWYSNGSEVDNTSDYWVYNHYTVYYDKTIGVEIKYNLSDLVVDEEFSLSEEDYGLLMEFLNSKECVKGSESDTSASDAPGVSITFYTPNGEEWSSFEGTWPTEKYQEIYTMLKAYVPEYDQPELYPKEVSEVGEEDVVTVPGEHLGLYVTYIYEEYSGLDYVYTYYDMDEDGLGELCIRRNDMENGPGNVIKYVDGGLQIFYQEEFPRRALEETWSVTSEFVDDSEDEEMIHHGISVYVDQNEYGENSFWYADKESFLESTGFIDNEPFYQFYNEDGSERLDFYYDEETEEGCGIRYYERDPTTFFTTGMYGFTFRGAEIVESDKESVDYFSTVSVEGYTGEDAAEDYEENKEHDDEGRLIHFDSTGILRDEEGAEPENILWIDYEYHANGNLKHRTYYHNSYIFGTGCSTWESSFDENGRLQWEDKYITHGNLDYYYMYDGDDQRPKYVLELDNNMGSWIPELKKYEE